MNQRKSEKTLVANHESRAPIQGGGFVSHEVAALDKPRLERSGGLGQAGDKIVKALKGHASASVMR